MLVQIPSTQTIEVKLPSFRKDFTHPDYYMINENGEIIHVYMSEHLCIITLTKRSCINFPGKLQDAVLCMEITPAEFDAAYKKAHDMQMNIVHPHVI